MNMSQSKFLQLIGKDSEMKQDKLEFSRLVNQIRGDERKYMTQKRSEDSASNGSCTSCKHCRPLGLDSFHCKLKAKSVKHYNYCEKWIAAGEGKGN